MLIISINSLYAEETQNIKIESNESYVMENIDQSNMKELNKKSDKISKDILQTINAIQQDRTRTSISKKDLQQFNETLKALPFIDDEYKSYTFEEAGNLGLTFGSIDQSYKRRIFVQNFFMYDNIIIDKKECRKGIGFRVLINCKYIDVKAKTTSLPWIAASASTNTVEATLDIKPFGIANPKMSEVFSNKPTNFSLDSYERLILILNKLYALVWDEDTILTPVVFMIPIPKSDEEAKEAEYNKAVFIAWALMNISKGNKLNDAIKSFPIDTNEGDIIITNVYKYFLKSDNPDVYIDPVSKARATEILRKVKIK